MTEAATSAGTCCWCGREQRLDDDGHVEMPESNAQARRWCDEARVRLLNRTDRFHPTCAALAKRAAMKRNSRG